MSAPLSTGGASPESQTWHELEDVFAALGQLARSSVAPQEFYRRALEQSVRALSAAGGAVWLRASNGAMQPIAYTGSAGNSGSRTDEMRRAHEALLIEATTEGRVISVAPHTVEEEHPDAANLTDHLLVLGPVQMPVDEPASGNAANAVTTLAIIEIWMRSDASPATYRGCEQFVSAVSELASDFHAFHELRRMRSDEHHRSELLELGRLVHSQLNLAATAYAVANEGRRVLGCDRLSVLVGWGRSCKLLAASGVSRIERRSGAARRLSKVAELVRRTDEPAHYADGECDALPPVAEAIGRHVEECHARHVAAIPLREPVAVHADDDVLSKSRRQRRSARPAFVLIAEQFDAREGELRRDWLVEVAEVSTTALYNALTVDRLPLGWLLRPMGRVKEAVATHLPRTALILGAIAAGIAALILVPADFNIEADGTMQPSVRRDVFAPRNGLVDEVLVKHGVDVTAGQALVRMRDPSLELELKRVDGELETAQRQLDAVRATRTNRAIRETNPVESYRLSAEERELEQKVTNARRELELLKHEREQLVVTSPITGRVLTWDVGHQLAARPVERGEVLVTVADLASPWQLELDVPDDRMGYVLQAQRELQVDLPVKFRLGSEEQATHNGRILEVCQTANRPAEKASRQAPTILTKVSLNAPELEAELGEKVRPGMSARAQIACGRQPVGYVWLHDIWDAAVEWWQF
jgi:multidrug efflux pump subunit AcrA (membrane-fusion protein)